MEKSEFETLMLAISGLKVDLTSKIEKEVGGLRGEINGLRGEVNDLRGEVNDLRNEMTAGFAEIRKDIKAIREQTADTVVRVTALEKRTEVPSA